MMTNGRSKRTLLNCCSMRRVYSMENAPRMPGCSAIDWRESSGEVSERMQIIQSRQIQMGEECLLLARRCVRCAQKVWSLLGVQRTLQPPRTFMSSRPSFIYEIAFGVERKPRILQSFG